VRRRSPRTHFHRLFKRPFVPENRRLNRRLSLIAHDGEAKTEEWAKGVVANFARALKGGDTDQIKSVAAGECGVVKFLEYLASDEAQRYFADGNNEWPVVAGVATDNPALAAMGKFKADNLPINAVARNVVAAQKLLDRAGCR